MYKFMQAWNIRIFHSSPNSNCIQCTVKDTDNQWQVWISVKNHIHMSVFYKLSINPLWYNLLWYLDILPFLWLQICMTLYVYFLCAISTSNICNMHPYIVSRETYYTKRFIAISMMWYDTFTYLYRCYNSYVWIWKERESLEKQTVKM